MKDYFADLVAPEANPLRRKNLVREYLQARILQGLQEHRAFLNWAFLGMHEATPVTESYKERYTRSTGKLYMVMVEVK